MWHAYSLEFLLCHAHVPGVVPGVEFDVLTGAGRGGAGLGVACACSQVAGVFLGLYGGNRLRNGTSREALALALQAEDGTVEWLLVLRV